MFDSYLINKAMHDALDKRVSATALVDEFMMERSNGDIIDYTKKDLAIRIAHTALENNRFIFYRDVEREKQERQFMPVQVHCTDAYIFSPEELRQMLLEFGSAVAYDIHERDLRRGFGMEDIIREKGRTQERV